MSASWSQAKLAGGVKAISSSGHYLPQVDRMLDLERASRFDQIEAAARVLGRTIEVRVS